MKSFNFRTLDLNLLRVFDAVVAEGSLTRAADDLAMTQPAVSNALRRLREAVGEELFTRTARGVKPTAFGLALAAEVRAALGRLRTVLDQQAYDPQRDEIAFTVAMADATAGVLLPPLMVRLREHGARMRLRTVPLVTRDPLPLLERGDADLAVGHFPDAMAALVTQGAGASFRHLRLSESEYRCVMRRDHPLAAAPLTLEAYCEAEHVLVSFSGQGHGFVDQALAALGRRRRIALTVNQFFTAGRVVARTDLLTVLPEGYLEVVARAEGLVGRPLPLAPGGVHVDAVWHMRHDGSTALAWLRDQFQAAALPRAAASVTKRRAQSSDE